MATIADKRRYFVTTVPNDSKHIQASLLLISTDWLRLRIRAADAGALDVEFLW